MPEDFRTRLAAALAAGRPRDAPPGAGRAAAVLLPVVGGPEPSLIFTVRSDALPSHKGQISFPGGGIDAADATPEAAALREAREELSLDPADVAVLGRLDALETFVSGYVVTPVVGWIDEPPALRPNPSEVVEAFAVPIAELTDDIRADPGTSVDGRPYPTEAWIYNRYVIWGVTARILRTFLTLLAESGLAPAPGGVAPPAS
jgi:8-oxo-dGTP pyrophosphatase MutT (NUDIX family)